MSNTNNIPLLLLALPAALLHCLFFFCVTSLCSEVTYSQKVRKKSRAACIDFEKKKKKKPI